MLDLQFFCKFKQRFVALVCYTNKARVKTISFALRISNRAKTGYNLGSAAIFLKVYFGALISNKDVLMFVESQNKQKVCSCELFHGPIVMRCKSRHNLECKTTYHYHYDLYHVSLTLPYNQNILVLRFTPIY